MAHIFDIAAAIGNTSGLYVDGKKATDQAKFPANDVFHGINKASRIEGDVFDLEVTGTIPPEIDGTFFRVQPDHRFAPVYEDDIHFNGDGNVTAIRIENGHAHFKQRFVRTDRYQVETKAKKALFGKYRNPYTDNEAVKGVIRTAANTNIIFWRGVLLATKEDGPAYAMDPETLETIGRYDFEGQVLSPTFTAHPKFDAETGEMICYGYEAGGNGNDASKKIVVYTIDKDGKKTEECWYDAPFCGIIHDCGISENYVVLPMTPLKAEEDRLKNGESHWYWDPSEDQLYGIVPRRGGKPEDIVWLRANNAFQGHTAGCYENEDGHIVFDLTIADGNVFFFFPPPGEPVRPPKLTNKTTRWILDPALPSGSRVSPFEEMDTLSGEFSRIDDRLVGKKYNHFWQCLIDPSRPYDLELCGFPVGGLFNCLGHYTWDKADNDVFYAGPTMTFQEPTLIPKGTGVEGEGWLIVLLNHLDVLRNDICIFDALNLAAGPVAVIKLPFVLKLGLHGNWVDQSEIKLWQERRSEGSDIGPARAAERPLPWQIKEAEALRNRSR